MSTRRFRLPSPALVISTVALSLVLGGAAFAATAATHTDAKADTKLIKKVAPSLSVKHADSANSATTAANAMHATSANTATSAASATNASELGGHPPSAYALSSVLGSPGPESNSAVSDSNCYLSEVRLMAGNQVPSNWHLADGSLLSISSNTALFSLLSTTYGGNGTTNFALPNLKSADPKGNGPAGVNYYICIFGVFP